MKSYYKKYPLLIFTSLVMATITALSALPYPLILKYFIDTVIPQKDVSEVLIWSIFLLVVIAIRITSNFFQNYTASIIEGRVARDLKTDLLNKVLKLPMSFFVNNDIGSIMSRISNDASRSVGLFRNYYLTLYSSIFFVAAALILMIRLNVILAILSLVLIPILALATALLNTKMAKESRKLSSANQVVTKELEEGLSGIETIKVDNLYSRVKDRFFRSLNDLLNVNLAINKYGVMAGAILTGIVSIGPILLLVVGTYLVLRGSTTIGTVVAITNLLLFLYEPIQQISLARVKIQTPRAVWKGVKELLEEEEEEEMTGAEPKKYNIAFDNVTFSYDGKRDVLNDVSIDAREGKFIAIVGRTGVGKSTILKLIPKFYLPQRGKITFNGNELNELSTHKIRDTVAYINRNVYIFYGTIKENIAIKDEEIDLKEIKEAARIACIDEEIEQMGGYGAFVGSRGKALSDGQRVRIGIARAVLKRPKVILIDEALTAVDSATESNVMKNLRGRFPHMTIILISHRLSSFKFADMIYVLERGKVAATGNYNDIKENTSFKTLFTGQLEM